MAIREILVVPHPVLKQVSTPVDVVDDALRALMDDMLETMYDAPGIGLAAVQIGVPKRVIVMDLSGKDEPRAPRYFVIPRSSGPRTTPHPTRKAASPCRSIMMRSNGRPA